MPIDLKVAPAATRAAAYARILQGVNANGTKPTPDNPAPFLSSDALVATVSPGQNLPSLFTPATSWFNPSLAQVNFSITAAQAANLEIDTQYLVEVFASRAGGDPWPVAAFLLPVLPAAGTQAAAAPPDLVTFPYATQLLGQLVLPEAALEAIPGLITAASNAIRKYCNRGFSKTDLVETVPVELDGSIRLREIPVNQVYRVQCGPQVALTVGNAAATSAWINQSFTGDEDSGLTITGLVLNWQSGGVTSSTPIAYTASMTINALATAINAAGNGWSATADSVLGAWPVTELYEFDCVGSKGASPNDTPDGAALCRVLARNGTARPHEDDGQKTGIFYVGRQGGSGDLWARAGLGWGDWDDQGRDDPGYVRVSYNAGFTNIPTSIQEGVVELVKLRLEQLKREFILASETAGEYSYTIAPELIKALPPGTLFAINQFKISNA